MYGLTLHGSAGVPMIANVLSGNTSDAEANRLHLDQLACIVPPAHEVTVVADCKLVDPLTLGQLLGLDFHFISRLPDSYALRKQLADLVLGGGAPLPELIRKKGRTQADPEFVWTGRSVVMPFPIRETPDAKPELRELRFLVMQSSGLLGRFDNALPRRLERERKAVEKSLRRLSREEFSCAGDAERALTEAPKGLRLHAAKGEVFEETLTLKRGRRGRPRAGEETPTRIVWRARLDTIESDEDRIAAARMNAGCVVLITDHLDREQWSDSALVEEYHRQHLIEGHCGFRWLKGPAAVAPMFLKTPSRMAALGLVFVLALMVRNWVQFTLRARLKETGETISYYADKKQTSTPTTEVALALFTGVMVTQVVAEGRVLQRRLTGLKDDARRVLELLGMDVAVFTRVRRKMGGLDP